MAGHEAGADLQQLRSLAAALRTRVSSSESLLAQHGARVATMEEYAVTLDAWRAEVDEALTELQDAPGKTLPIEWWLITDAERAATALIDLNEWVGAVYLPAGGALPLCWPLHGQVVTELLSLRAMHRKAVKTKGPAEYSTWLKLRRDSVEAIQSADTMSKCGVTHVAFGDHFEVDPAVVEMGDIARWWVAGRGADGTVPTGLTVKDEDDR